MNKLPQVCLCYVGEDRAVADEIKQWLEREAKCHAIDYIAKPLSGKREQAIRARFKASVVTLFLASKNSARELGVVGGNDYSLEVNIANQMRPEWGYEFRLVVKLDDVSNSDLGIEYLEAPYYQHWGNKAQRRALVDEVVRTLSEVRRRDGYVDINSGLVDHLDNHLQDGQIQESAKALADSVGIEEYAIFVLADRRKHVIPDFDDERRYSVQIPQRYKNIAETLAGIGYRQSFRPIGIHFANGKLAAQFSEASMMTPFLEAATEWLVAKAVGQRVGNQEWIALTKISLRDALLTPLNPRSNKNQSKFRVIPLKFILDPRNRDIVGVLVARWRDEHAVSAMSSDMASLFEEMFRAQCLPWLREARLVAMQFWFTTARTRQQLQDHALDAALGLAGGDWGCIKSACLAFDHGANSHLASAECVFHCPAFFKEGNFPDTELVLRRVIEGGKDACIGVGRKDIQNPNSPHPAQEMFVTLVRDEETDPTRPRIEPRMDGHTDIVGAIVVQHADDDYLSKTQSIYEPLLRRIANALSTAFTGLAHADILRSVQTMRTRYYGDGKLPSLESWIDGAMHLAGEGNSFELYWFLLDITPKGQARLVLHSANLAKEEKTGRLDHQEMLSIAGMKGYATPEKQSSIMPSSPIEIACNSKSPLLLRDVSAESGVIWAQRSIYHTVRARALFADEFAKESKLTTELMVDLGSRAPIKLAQANPDAKKPWNVSVVPLVFSSGLPVGVIIVFGKGDFFQSLDNLQEKTQVIARIMYLRKHNLQMPLKDDFSI